MKDSIDFGKVQTYEELKMLLSMLELSKGSYIQLEQLLYKYQQLGGMLAFYLSQDISTQRTLLLSHKLE
ncbi:hypothetical protein [Ligilactobacillus salivarius]|uniref:hypothetical protein n=1 Tax=Ligilactobacillus salivarius TaxID=1624 RepID=UPI0024BA35BA|nr:hypothetical protein [Ligilactobacillus salivarius]